MTLRTLFTFSFLALSLYGYPQIPDNSTWVEDNSAADDAEEVYYQEEESASDQYILYPDSAAVSNPVSIDRKSWNKLTDDDAFSYAKVRERMRDDAPRENSWLRNIMQAILQFFSGAGSWIIWVLAGAIILIVLYKILDHLKLGKNNITRGTFTTAELQGAQPAADLESLIAMGLEAHRIPETISYMYQHIIYLMQQRAVIGIGRETTNAEILRMTRQLPYHKELKSLISRFEYVYFGEYPVSETQFEQYRRTYQSLKQQLT